MKSLTTRTRILTATLSVMAVGSMVFGPIAVMRAPTAHAIPVVETGANLAVNSASASNEAFQTTILNVLNGLAWTASKTVIQSMTQSIVTWINSGFDGSPAFVSDLNRNLSGLADAVAEDFLFELDRVVVSSTGLSVRAPFQDQISAGLREEFYRTTSSYGFDVRHPYTDCYQGGGFSFDSWFCESQNPANNPYGRYALAREELWRRIDNEAQNRIRELGWGNGFLSWRGQCGPYGSGNSTAGPGGINGNVNLSQRETNVGCSIRTPGTVIEDQLVNSLGSPVRQLELADSVNEIIGALMSQMVNQVLGGGGLSGISQPSSGGGTSYLNRATDPSQYGQTASTLADGLVREVTRQQTAVETYRSNWQRIAGAASSAQQACTGAESQEAGSVLARANTNIARANTAITTIDALQNQIASSRQNLNSSTAVTDTVGAYQSLLSGSSLPTPEETADAQTQSQDTGDEEPGSLYSRMIDLARTCR